jgi:hypothetical protein
MISCAVSFTGSLRDPDVSLRPLTHSSIRFRVVADAATLFVTGCSFVDRFERG